MLDQTITQLTLSTHLIRQLVQQGLLDPHQTIKLMSPNGIFQQTTIGQLLNQNTEIILDQIATPLAS